MAKKRQKDLIVGIDIGGTKVKLVLMRGQKILAEDRYLLKSLKTAPQFLATLIAHIESLIKEYPKYRIKGIGIGLPGILDKSRKRVIIPPNLKVIRKINFIKALEANFNLPVRLENDTNVMALAEMIFGAGRGKESLVFLSLGTGVGGGVVFREAGKLRLLTGYRGAAGEIGRMVINFNGPKGRAGIKGDLEQYTSLQFIRSCSSKHPLTIQQEAIAGKKVALNVYKELGHYLGFGLANVVNIFDPEIIVLGGGISEAYKLFIKPAKQTMKANVLSPHSVNIPVVKSKLQDRAGAMGAAALWLTQYPVTNL